MVNLKGYADMSMKQKYALYGIKKNGYLDVETTNLVGDFGFMLSWAMYVRDTQDPKKDYIVYDVITKKDISDAVKKREITMDKRILENMFSELEDIDLLVGHYFHGWRKMDMPFIRTRAAMCKIKTDVLNHKKKRFADTWKMAHLLHKIHSYRLDAVSHIFGIETEKTRLDEKVWQLAKFGDEKSLRYVIDHNIKDVQITYEVHKQLEKYMSIPAGYV